MTRSEIPALLGKVLMGASYGCPWKRQIPEAEVACQGIWLHLAHEELYVENARNKIRVGEAPASFDETGAFWVSRDTFGLWRPLRGVRVLSAAHEGESTVEMAFGDGTILLICGSSTDRMPVADWPSGLPLLIVSRKGEEFVNSGDTIRGTPY